MAHPVSPRVVPVRRMALALGLGAVSWALVGVVGSATAHAQTAAATADGTIACSTVEGTLIFSPPLTNGGTAAEKVTLKAGQASCTTAGNTNLPPGTITGKLVATSHGVNSCATLGLGSSFSGKSTYKQAGVKIGATAFTSGTSVATDGDGNTTIQLPKPHHLKGSFANEEVVSYADLTTNTTEAQLEVFCTKGLKSAKVVSGQTWW